MAHILIAGENALAAGIERDLASRGHATLRYSSPAFALSAEDLEEALAFVLAGDNDGTNVSLALRARRLSPGLHLVVRVFDRALVRYLSETVPDVQILSMSAITAPLFAEEAKKVLAASRPADKLRVPRRPLRRRFHVDRMLVGALLSLFLLVFPSAAFFAHALNLRYMDALYFVWTTVMTVGYGDISLKDASDGAKLYGMALMLSGAAFIAILFALLSDWVMSRRLDVLRGRIPERGTGHVLVAGAGNIGFRVCGLLAPTGCRLVVVERQADSRNAELLSAAGHHVIVADVTNDETLELAGLYGAALVMALTDSDAVNLEVALHARRVGVPVIMRVDSQELAMHVADRGDAITLSPVAAATKVFADAAINRGQIPLQQKGI